MWPTSKLGGDTAAKLSTVILAIDQIHLQQALLRLPAQTLAPRLAARA
jgi:hypothetical protein